MVCRSCTSFSVLQFRKQKSTEFLAKVQCTTHTFRLLDTKANNFLLLQQQQQQQPQKKMVVSKKIMKVGPWGGAGGSPWGDGGHTGIRSITLSYDRCIDSIAVEYDRNGVAVPGERHGGAGGNQTTQIKLSFPEEYLTTVSGHYAVVAQGGAPAIRSLAFRTNRREYGPFGAAEGTPFAFPVDGGAIRVLGEERLAARRCRPARCGAAAGDHVREGEQARAHGVPLSNSSRCKCNIRTALHSHRVAELSRSRHLSELVVDVISKNDLANGKLVSGH